MTSAAQAQSVDIYDYNLEGPRNSQLWDRYYLLFLQDITAVFDGFKALDISDLGIGHNELRVVVGPNGAGKTTMCDVVSGLTSPTTGSVYFDGRDITGHDEATIAQKGVGRKFQVPNVFDSLTVWDNMLLAVQPEVRDTKEIVKRLESWDPRVSGPAGVMFYRMASAFRNVGGRPNAECRDRMLAILERVRLIDHLDVQAKNLSHGQRQWLAISTLMVARPKLLLVDEPAAGLTDHETELTAALLNELKGDHTIICIEHDMDFVRALDSRVTVLNEGRILADGTLDEVSADEQVIAAYLGR
jgi:urea transport system ATP-binding protein